MDINAAKLKRVIAYLNDDGVASPEKIAEILRAQPKNTNFLRAYVAAACAEIGDEAALKEFDGYVSGPVEETPAPAPIEYLSHEVPSKAAPEPVKEVEKPVVQAKAPEPTSAPQEVFLLNADSTLTRLQIFKHTATRLVLEIAKEKREVKVFLRGEIVTVDLLDLKPVTVKGVTFTVADLELIAKAADV